MYVFISHTVEDAQAAESLRRFVLSSLGATTEIFLSSHPGAIPGGADWFMSLRNEVTRSDVVLVLLSQTSLGRPWVNIELGAALITSKLVVPVALGSVDKRQLPSPYNRLQAVSAHSRNEMLALVERLSREFSSRTIDGVECSIALDAFLADIKPRRRSLALPRRLIVAAAVVVFGASMTYVAYETGRGGTSQTRGKDRQVLERGGKWAWHWVEFTKLVVRGEQLVQGKTIDLSTVRLWRGEVEGLILGMDPVADINGEGTLYSVWWHAGWFNGNYPKNDVEEKAVLAQQVGVLRSIANSKEVAVSKR